MQKEDIKEKIKGGKSMYIVRLGDEMHNDTYDFVFSNFDEVINFVKISLANGHRISIKLIEEEEEENV